MNMQFPKVSIIIPVYNGSDYLANAINCALQQTYKNIEIIVVNDGSADEGRTEEIALSYKDQIRYFYKENGGVSSALNYGIRMMTGQYFSWLSHDDAYSPDKIMTAVELLKKHNALDQKVIAFTGGWFIDTSGVRIGGFPGFFEKDKLYSGLEVINVMTKKGTLNGCCMLIPKMAFEDVGFFDETLRYSQDSLMWYELFLQDYALISDNLPNVMYRLHCNQASQRYRTLYERDALVIAKRLALPLAEIDSTGKMLFRYIKRLTKYQCTDAISYLYQYAENCGFLSLKTRLAFYVYNLVGFFRYKVVTFVKKRFIRSR